jgi:arylsulfatase A-like enzyme
MSGMTFRIRLAPVLALFLFATAGVSAAADARKPNVVFIAIDDLNDWLGCMGTHPLVKTPHIDALAARGTLFTNAHTNSVLCNPSRTSLMTGLRPTSTGIYGLKPWFRDVPEFADLTTLPQHFANHGYRTLTTGKIYHVWRKPAPGEKHIEFEVAGPEGGLGARPPKKLIGNTPFGNHSAMDWGVWPPDNDDTKTADYQVAQWAADRITNPPAGDDRPYFLAAGFFFPHVPCYATQKWFDLYPADASILPEIPANDRADTPRSAWWLHWSLPEPRLRWLQENDQHINLVRSYLACISFVDSLVGKITAAVEASGQADNTVIVLWSDHGYHLGEKDISGKNTLWARSTRVPLIFAGPGVTPGQVCTRPVELLDIYPTLSSLAALPAPAHPLEGLSLVPQLRDAATPRERPALSNHNQGNHAVVTEDWRFIRYVDGAEELYDLRADPNEWNNLAAARPEIRATLRQHLPTVDRGPAPGSAHRVLTYYDKTPVWEGSVIEPDAPVPHDTPK